MCGWRSLGTKCCDLRSSLLAAKGLLGWAHPGIVAVLPPVRVEKNKIINGGVGRAFGWKGGGFGCGGCAFLCAELRWHFGEHIPPLGCCLIISSCFQLTSSTTCSEEQHPTSSGVSFRLVLFCPAACGVMERWANTSGKAPRLGAAGGVNSSLLLYSPGCLSFENCSFCATLGEEGRLIN